LLWRSLCLQLQRATKQMRKFCKFLSFFELIINCAYSFVGFSALPPLGLGK
jgi:hypothetical protein